MFIATPISIHAPRGGSDVPCGKGQDHPSDFNPRSPWGERHDRPVEGLAGAGYFNPRSPWGERHLLEMAEGSLVLFQSTLPVGGATARQLRFRRCSADFNPRSPWGERHCLKVSSRSKPGISIHAPRGGSDSRSGRVYRRAANFNPRSPWGERLPQQPKRSGQHYFNPRSPWGERPS